MGSLGCNGGVLPCVGTPRPASPCTEPAALRDDMVHWLKRKNKLKPYLIMNCMQLVKYNSGVAKKKKI